MIILNSYYKSNKKYLTKDATCKVLFSHYIDSSNTWNIYLTVNISNMMYKNIIVSKYNYGPGLVKCYYIEGESDSFTLMREP